VLVTKEGSEPTRASVSRDGKLQFTCDGNKTQVRLLKACRENAPEKKGYLVMCDFERLAPGAVDLDGAVKFRISPDPHPFGGFGQAELDASKAVYAQAGVGCPNNLNRGFARVPHPQPQPSDGDPQGSRAAATIAAAQASRGELEQDLAVAFQYNGEFIDEGFSAPEKHEKIKLDFVDEDGRLEEFEFHVRTATEIIAVLGYKQLLTDLGIDHTTHVRDGRTDGLPASVPQLRFVGAHGGLFGRFVYAPHRRLTALIMPIPAAAQVPPPPALAVAQLAPPPEAQQPAEKSRKRPNGGSGSGATGKKQLSLDRFFSKKE
jgi:hypothetical protein